MLLGTLKPAKSNLGLRSQPFGPEQGRKLRRLCAFIVEALMLLHKILSVKVHAELSGPTDVLIGVIERGSNLM